MKNYEIKNSENLSIQIISEIIENGYTISLSKECIEEVENCRNYLEELISNENIPPIYGINTGFGDLHGVEISSDDLEKLQENLVKSHACGLGREIPQKIVKTMLLLKVKALSKGYSGIKLDTLERLIFFFNQNILPVVFEQGSLGASGDLSPLAHLSLPLIGEGKVNYKNEVLNANEILEKFNLKPIKLGAKEGLALLNGTQFMAAYSVLIIEKAKALAQISDFVACISIEAFEAKMEPFSEEIHAIRPHNGQVVTAQNIRFILADSELANATKKHVQDPYSFRCIPQVHGSSKDIIKFAENTILTEINSVTDNPTIFYKEKKVISAGNFHGQQLALMFDMLSMAIAELGSISERRIFKLVSGQRSLPPFLAANPGLNSGFMIPQYTAASIVSKNKQLCTPSSIDTIDSSNGQEDHVSMGANAGVKCFEVIENVYKIYGIELFNASQALFFRKSLKSATSIEKALIEYRKKVNFVEFDKVMHDEMLKSIDFLNQIQNFIPQEVKSY
jgi:histidine ammonia-lyase